MRNKKAICAILWLSLAAPFSATAATLSDTVSTAVMNHPRLDSSRALRNVADQTMRENKSQFYPVLSATARGGHVNSNDDTTRGATGGDASSFLGEGSLTLTQPLFAGFSNMRRVEAAAERIAASEKDIDGSAEDIAFTAARAHLNIMRTEELRDHAAETLKKIKGLKENITLMVKEGAANEAEALEAEEILLSSQSTELSFSEAHDQAIADYQEAVGAAPSDKLYFGDPLWNAHVPASVDDAVKQALETNPRLLSSARTVAAMTKDVAAEKGQLFPKFDAEVSYNEKDQDDNLGGESNSTQAMVKMSWNFSTGGAELARIRRSREQQADARARQMEMARVIERTIRQNYIAMEGADQQLSLAVGREQASQKVLDNYMSQFEGGKQSNLQIMGAEAKLFQARIAKVEAYYRSLLARFELLNTLGLLGKALAAPADTAQK